MSNIRRISVRALSHFPESLRYYRSGQELLIGELRLRMQEALLPRLEALDYLSAPLRRGRNCYRRRIQLAVRFFVLKTRKFKPICEDQPVYLAPPCGDGRDLTETKACAIDFDV